VLARPEAADEGDRLLERLELLRRGGPVAAERRFVQRFARPEADEAPSREHRLERGEGLSDEGRVVAPEADRDRRPDRHALRRLRCGAQPHPGLAGLSRLPPGLEVIAARDAVEAGALAADGLLEQLSGRKLLVRATEVLDGHGAGLSDPAPPKRPRP